MTIERIKTKVQSFKIMCTYNIKGWTIHQFLSAALLFLCLIISSNRLFIRTPFTILYALTVGFTSAFTPTEVVALAGVSFVFAGVLVWFFSPVIEVVVVARGFGLAVSVVLYTRGGFSLDSDFCATRFSLVSSGCFTTAAFASTDSTTLPIGADLAKSVKSALVSVATGRTKSVVWRMAVSFFSDSDTTPVDTGFFPIVRCLGLNKLLAGFFIEVTLVLPIAPRPTKRDDRH